MQAAAQNAALRKLLTSADLRKCLSFWAKKPEAIPCEAIKGIIKEGDEVAEEFKGEPALDAGLIAAAQAVEHYEIVRYGAMRAWAEKLSIEPSRVCRRPFRLSHAAMAGSASMA
jgi:ferritin-like metal-binding protein YciE